MKPGDEITIDFFDFHGRLIRRCVALVTAHANGVTEYLEADGRRGRLEDHDERHGRVIVEVL